MPHAHFILPPLILSPTVTAPSTRRSSIFGIWSNFGRFCLKIHFFVPFRYFTIFNSLAWQFLKNHSVFFVTTRPIRNRIFNRKCLTIAMPTISEIFSTKLEALLNYGTTIRAYRLVAL